MDNEQHLSHYEYLLVEAVRHAPTVVQRAVATVLGHYGPACDSDHHSQEGEINELHWQRSEALRYAEEERQRADIAEENAQYYEKRAEELEANCEWYKQRIEEIESSYEAQLAALNDKLHKIARDHRSDLEDIADKAAGGGL
jgi:ABC-type Zn2+ transport system substrate-binding protein/surface adhesin